MSKYCTNCGLENNDNTNFCINCGSELRKPRENIQPNVDFNHNTQQNDSNLNMAMMANQKSEGETILKIVLIIILLVGVFIIICIIVSFFILSLA